MLIRVDLWELEEALNVDFLPGHALRLDLLDVYDRFTGEQTRFGTACK